MIIVVAGVVMHRNREGVRKHIENDFPGYILLEHRYDPKSDKHYFVMRLQQREKDHA